MKYWFIESSHHPRLASTHHTHLGYKIGQRFHYDQFPTKTSPPVPEQILGWWCELELNINLCGAYGREGGGQYDLIVKY